MKIVYISIFLSLLFQVLALAQTPSQQKQLEDAQRQADSIMNLPQVKEMMAKVKAMEAQLEQQPKEEKPVSVKPTKRKFIKEKPMNTKGEDDFYWYNTIESKTNSTFSKWPYGNTQIKATYYNKNMKPVDVVIGNISNKGLVSFSKPSFNDEDLLPIERSFFESERTLEKSMSYSNIKAPYISFRFITDVYKGDKRIGSLKMGNAIKPVVNLNSPCCLDKGHKGDFLYWVYLGDNCTITHRKSLNLKTSSGPDTGYINYNLKFTKGWNLVKISVKDNYLKHNQNVTTEPTYLAAKATEYSTISTIPNDIKYYFTKESY